jgi:putative redox protein
MRSEQVVFSGAQGGKLSARLDLPDGEICAYALFAHCFTCTKDIFAATQICTGLTVHGIAVLRFDFTGLGHSEGEFANTNFSSNIGDLIAAADWMKEQGHAPQLLIGHSLGGAACIVAAGKIDSVKAVATIAAPADPAHVAAHFVASRPEIEERGEAEVYLAGRPFRIRKQFLDDIQSYRMHEHTAGLHRALLVMHAPGDETVGIENATQIFMAAKHPKSYVSLDHADHLLRRREDAQYVARVLAAWASHYITEMAWP